MPMVIISVSTVPPTWIQLFHAMILISQYATMNTIGRLSDTKQAGADEKYEGRAPKSPLLGNNKL